jgi:hypothetical protein
MKVEEKKKIVTKILWRCFIILLIAFTALYLSEATGYYEYEQHKNMVLTSEKIKEFEQDVKDGKNIDIENYVATKEKDYSSSVSNLGLDISSSIDSFVTDGLNSFFKFLGDMANG